jgi:hypothetical protein
MGHAYIPFHPRQSEKNENEKEISESATSLPFRNYLGIGRYQISGILRDDTILLGRQALLVHYRNHTGPLPRSC